MGGLTLKGSLRGWVWRFRFLLLSWGVWTVPDTSIRLPDQLGSSHPNLLTLRRRWVKLFVSRACSRRSRAPRAKQDSLVPLQTFRNDWE